MGKRCRQMDYDPAKFTDEFIRGTAGSLMKEGKISEPMQKDILELLPAWRNDKERSVSSIKQKIAEGGPLKFFVISALTHIETKREFDYNNEMINHIMLMMWNEFNYHYGSSALLTNESQLKHVPKEWVAPLTYMLDQRSVRTADLIIAILSYPSQGLGQEMEHARENGVPIIGILQKTKLSKKRLTYATFSYDGELEERTLFKGRSGSSTMVVGNPSINYLVSYPKNTFWTDFLQGFDNLAWRLQYWRKRGSLPYKFFKKLGKWLHPILEERNPRTIGLRNMHAALVDIGFAAESGKAKARADELGAKEELGEADARELQEKQKRFERLRKLQNFHPIHRNNMRMYYDARFPLETRVPGGEENRTKIVMGVYMRNPRQDGSNTGGNRGKQPA